MSSRKLLLIDDEDDIREVASLTLETMADFQVRTAPSGVAGLAMAGRERPDVILLDLMMPGMDGYTTFALTAGIGADARDSRDPHDGQGSACRPQRLGSLGARGIIAKPFDPLTLSDQVLALLAS